MDREINLDSICALDEQISEYERTVIKLKRARNSFLNVSKFPPEVLGKIFHQNVTLEDDFGGLDEGSHNFLLVCHHWFEVASRTPNLWSFWGSTPKDWARWSNRSRTAPLDLVLDGDECKDSHLNATLCNILRDRATRDTIRRAHLRAKDPVLLSSIVTQLTANREELQSDIMESFILRNWGDTLVDVSDFFVHRRFPKLRRLHLYNCTISSPSWDHLSRTSVLTTLFLNLLSPSPTPTTSQLFSILSSNPTLRKVVLTEHAIPDDDGGGSSFRVQLHHLKELRLEGDLRHIIRLLHQLDYPGNMEDLTLGLHGCDDTDISQTIGPHLRDYLQHHDRPRNGLNLFVTSQYSENDAWEITLYAGNAEGIDLSTPERADTFVTITVRPNDSPDGEELERMTLDLIAYVPREEVFYFRVLDTLVNVEDTSAQFPNVRAPALDTILLYAPFPSPNPVEDVVTFPLLEHVLLEGIYDDNWSPLVDFLARRASLGNRLDTLVIRGSHVCLEVAESIRGMVRELVVDRPIPGCPLGTCPEP